MIGLGTQDTFDQAKEFVDRHSISFDMVWDDTFDSWTFYGVTGQPAYALVSAEGKFVDGGFGMFPESIVDKVA